MTLFERMVEEGARAVIAAGYNPATALDVSRAALTAALSLAARDGAVLAVVPNAEEMPEWMSPGRDWPGWESGFNACRAALLAGKVTP